MLCLIRMTASDSIDWCVVFPVTAAHILSTKHLTRMCIIKLRDKNPKRKPILGAQFWICSAPLQCPQSIPETVFYTYIIIYFSVFSVCEVLRSFCPKFVVNFLSLALELHIWNIPDSAIFCLRFCAKWKIYCYVIHKISFPPCLLPIRPIYCPQNF